MHFVLLGGFFLFAGKRTEIEEPVGASGEGVGFLSGFDRVYFGWVELCFGKVSKIHELNSMGRLTHGNGNQLAPKLAIYVNSPTAAPFAAAVVPGIKQENTMTILKH